MTRSPTWYDRQYNNRANIPEHPAILQDWFDSSVRARTDHPCRRDRRYGDGEAEALDVFLPGTGRPAPPGGAPVLVYIHGGYWRALGKGDQSFVAPPLARAGALVVLPGYALAPRVGIDHIVLQIARAVAWTWRHAREHGGDPGRIVVAGHSAGGHLAAMMLCCRWSELAPDLPPGLVRGALALSGLFDLEPLRHAPFLAPDLRLDEALARKLSPAALPAPAGPLHALVGGDEKPEFQRQNRLIRRRWGARAVPVCEAIPRRHHMSILRDLADPSARAHRLALSLLGLEAASVSG
jgi:arylformamidase